MKFPPRLRRFIQKFRKKRSPWPHRLAGAACVLGLLALAQDQGDFLGSSEREAGPRALASLASLASEEKSLPQSHQHAGPEFALPSHCYLPVPNTGYSFVGTDFYVGNVRVDELIYKAKVPALGDSAPQVFFIREECKPRLEALVQATQDGLFLNHEEAAFPYKPSSPRPYCGTQPTPSSVCPYETPQDPTIVLRLDQDQVPADLSHIVQAMSDPADRHFAPGTGKRVQLFATPTPHSGSGESSLKALLWGRKKGNLLNQSGKQVKIREYHVTYLRVTGPRDEKRDADSGDLRERVTARLYRWSGGWAKRHSTHWLQKNTDASDVVQYLLDASSQLLQYWQDGYDLLDKQPAPGAPRPALRLESFEAGIELPLLSRYDEQERRARKIHQLIEEITRRTIVELSHALAHPEDGAELLDAASLWWAARSLQIRFGCDPESDTPFDFGTSLVMAQYEHQTCRAYYTHSAFLSLSRMLKRQKQLRLDSLPWMTVMALGSRQERLDLLSRALPILERQMESGMFLSARELGALAQQALQVSEELRRSQVLTWNGFQPASPLDLDKLQRMRSEFARFLPEAGRVLVRGRSTEPALYARFRILWGWLEKDLGLRPWTQEFPSESSGAPLSELSRALTGLTLRPIDDSYFRDLHALFETTQQDILDGKSSPEEPCSAWLEWVDRVKNPPGGKVRLPELIPSRAAVEKLGCFKWLPEWVKVSNPAISALPSALETQCRKGHALSCLSLAALRPQDSILGPDDWKRILAQEPVPVRLSIELYKRFKAELQRGLKQNKATQLAWKRAFQAIHEFARDQAISETAAPLAPRELEFCVAPSTWTALAASPQIRAAAAKAELLPSCPTELRARARQTLIQISSLRKILERKLSPDSPASAWNENALSAATRYVRWIKTLGQSALQAVPKNNRLREEQVDIRLRAFAPYFRELAMVSSRFDLAKEPWVQIGRDGSDHEILFRLRNEIHNVTVCEEPQFQDFCLSQFALPYADSYQDVL